MVNENTKPLFYFHLRYTPDLDPEVRGYSVWGCTVTEVEVDILTGEMFIVRSDIIEDAGLSTSPQVEQNFLLKICII